MATWWVDPTAGDTVAALTVSAGDTIAIKCGTTLREQLTGANINVDNLRITQYGSGANPIISGADVVSSWTQDVGNGVWYTSIGSNIAGNVREDGVPMRATAWTTNIATTAPNIPAGGFAFDFSGFILYIKPSAGAPSAHVYEVSKRLYCINSGGVNTGLVVEGVDIHGASRHGIVLTNKTGFVFRGGAVRYCGGYYQASITARLGNGIELAAGCNDALVENAEITDIFDACGTSQLYEASAASLARHTWRNNNFARARLAGVEVSAQTANQTISNIWVYGNTFVDISSSAGWAGTSSSGAGFNLTNNGGATCTLSGIYVNDNTFASCPKWSVLLNAGARQSSVFVERNVIDTVGLRGVRVLGPATIRSNLIRQNTYGIEVVGSAAPTVNVTNNTLDANYYAMYGDSNSAQLIAKNNIITNNRAPYAFSGATTVLTCSNNALYGNEVIGSYTSSNDVTANPLLTADYKLTQTSPLIGAGTHLGYTRDIEGKQRPNPPAIGAFDAATLRPKLTTDPAA